LQCRDDARRANAGKRGPLLRYDGISVRLRRLVAKKTTLSTFIPAILRRFLLTAICNYGHDLTEQDQPALAE